jgi:hypothetical protein
MKFNGGKLRGGVAIALEDMGVTIGVALPTKLLGIGNPGTLEAGGWGCTLATERDALAGCNGIS